METASVILNDAGVTEVSAPAVANLAEAYAWCGRLAQSHYENFTIASWLMPRAMRPHMHAIYAYARIADDFADVDKSLAKLDEGEHELDAAIRQPVAAVAYYSRLIEQPASGVDVHVQPAVDGLGREHDRDAGFHELTDRREYRGRMLLAGRVGRDVAQARGHEHHAVVGT